MGRGTVKYDHLREWPVEGPGVWEGLSEELTPGGDVRTGISVLRRRSRAKTTRKDIWGQERSGCNCPEMGTRWTLLRSQWKVSVSGVESDGGARWGRTSEAVEGSLHFTLRPTETPDW